MTNVFLLTYHVSVGNSIRGKKQEEDSTHLFSSHLDSSRRVVVKDGTYQLVYLFECLFIYLRECLARFTIYITAINRLEKEGWCRIL